MPLDAYGSGKYIDNVNLRDDIHQIVNHRGVIFKV